ncbi:hypothetical protein [Halapricum hydrolyticum]|uniref:Uncharacterized protein n=1 Tax=Halapricum hydrolyticum TaxID=2979991 RepID=A0AAE3LJE0_9EURY|nr:hypothetical protein [Halapricum hydrolyticum]MCU4718334.1 hypothetical protein [Halapricum hydrolyticum]MCU4727218.1 hypothetical protein [Halapricum hydrolyticum]
MSSYDPPEEDESTSSYDPGVKEREVTDKREFKDLLLEADRIDYIVYGVLLGIPAGILTTILVWHFIPGFSETAEALLRWLLDVVSAAWA